MKDCDMVTLIIVTEQNHLPAGPFTKQVVSDWIKQWESLWLKAGGIGPEAEEAKNTIQFGTWYGLGDNGLKTWSVRINCMVGMYISDHESLHERQVAAAEKLARAAEKEMGSGEEWKEEGQ